MNKVIDDKIMETKRTLSQIHRVRHLVTLTLDAGDDSETTTALMIASKIAEDKLTDGRDGITGQGGIRNPPRHGCCCRE